MWASYARPASGYQGHNLTLILIRSHLDHPNSLTAFIQIGLMMHLGLLNTPASSPSFVAVFTLPFKSLDVHAVHQITSQPFLVLLGGPQSKPPEAFSFTFPPYHQPDPHIANQPHFFPVFICSVSSCVIVLPCGFFPSEKGYQLQELLSLLLRCFS